MVRVEGKLQRKTERMYIHIRWMCVYVYVKGWMREKKKIKMDRLKQV